MRSSKPKKTTARSAVSSMRFVGYARVSTQQQGRSGLGLEAQQRAIDEHVLSVKGDLLATYTEVETGKRNDRPELTKALSHCTVTGSTLLIAKLDRLSRNAVFLLQLRDSGVRFICADMPQANDLTIGVLALVAQQELESISRRTREALAVARARGVRLGCPTKAGIRALKACNLEARTASAAVRRRKAREYATHIRPQVERLRAEGYESLTAIALALNERGVLTRWGKPWSKGSLWHLLRYLELTA